MGSRARGTVLELCVETPAGVETAQQAGADRVELAAELWNGGLTPSLALIEQALQRAPLHGVRVLVRENPTSFELSGEQTLKQAASIREIVDRFSADVLAEHLPPLGIVVGGLAGNEIDLEGARLWKEAAGPLPVVFHRAFDQTRDQAQALEQLVELGYEGVLTTGGTGRDASIPGLRALVEQAAGRIEIIGSGGLRADNIARVIRDARLQEAHFRAPYPTGDCTDPKVAAAIVKAARSAL